MLDLPAKRLIVNGFQCLFGVPRTIMRRVSARATTDAISLVRMELPS